MTFLTLFVSSVFVVLVSSQDDPCLHWTKYTVTINKGQEPYWYQKTFGPCVNGESLKDIQVYSLHFPDGFKDGRAIANFPILKEIYLDRTKLREVPRFYNMPKLTKISLSNNAINRIKNGSLEQVSATNLIFSTNNISKIEPNSFGEQVTEIYLTCNRLAEISRDWFVNPAKLNRLNIGGNLLTNIPENMFKDFLSLQNIQLRNNHIVTIGAGAFAGPRNLQYLHLGYNNISEILPEVFPEKMNISYMDVQYNRLSFLHQSMMNRLQVHDFRIWGNPWQCPCKDIIMKWIAKNNENYNHGLSRDGDPSCVIALSFSDRCVPFVDDELYKTFLENFQLFPVKFCENSS